jgi:glycosyltransferase involved in cell wall biosynthesis
MSQKKKNILLLINQLHSGGAEKVIAGLSMDLSSDYNIVLAIYNDIEKPVLPHKGELIRIRLPYAEDPASNSSLKRLVRFLKLIYNIRRLKKDKKIDVAISFLEASNIINVLSRRSEKAIVSVRSYLSNEFQDDKRLKVFRYLISTLYNKAYNVVVPSEQIQSDLVTNFGVSKSKIAIIYNYIDMEHIQLHKTKPVDEEKVSELFTFPTVINVGRLTNPKGQWLLLPAFHQVKKHIPNVKLIILGDGPLREKIISAADKNNLKCYTGTESYGKYDVSNFKDFDVYLLGFQNNIYPYLSRSTVFALSSLYEGFPNVIIEAMACGLPVITSDCASGPREILAPNTSFENVIDNVEYAQYGILLPLLSENSEKTECVMKQWSQVMVQILSNDDIRQNYISLSLERAKAYKREAVLSKWKELINK